MTIWKIRDLNRGRNLGCSPKFCGLHRGISIGCFQLSKKMYDLHHGRLVQNRSYNNHYNIYLSSTMHYLTSGLFVHLLVYSTHKTKSQAHTRINVWSKLSVRCDVRFFAQAALILSRAFHTSGPQFNKYNTRMLSFASIHAIKISTNSWLKILKRRDRVVTFGFSEILNKIVLKTWIVLNFGNKQESRFKTVIGLFSRLAMWSFSRSVGMTSTGTNSSS